MEMRNRNGEMDMEQRKTPLMGWASWNCFRTNITEETLKRQADALVSTGLAACGYEYLNIDDGFFGGRDGEGNILAHAERFPNGMKILAEYAHGLGLKAGIYSDAGDNTCGFYYDGEGKNGAGVGLYGHEEKDLYTYLVDWGYDFIKVDWCGGLRLGLEEEEQYGKIGRIIQEIREKYGRSIVYNICRWQFPGEWAAEIADSWRTGADICVDFNSVMHQLDMIKPLRRYCKPGHVNDLDMLQIGNGMSQEEDRTHFAMWCMMSAPLMIGCDLTKVSDETLEILTNRELIAIQQDAACLQAFVVKDFYEGEELVGEVWVKYLGCENETEKAVAFLNRSTKPLEMSVSLEEAGLTGDSAQIRIRDVSAQKDLPGSKFLRVELPAHGCKVLRITAPEAVVIDDRAPITSEIRVEKITPEQARQLAGKGACLVDVREKEEFETFHLPEAVNIPYTEIHGIAKEKLPELSRTVVVYCRTGKRGFQSAKTLKTLGYQEVYYCSLCEEKE